jgi:hypothetical protein
MPSSGDNVKALDYTTLASYTSGRPVGRLIQQAAQSIPGNTNTLLLFGAGSTDIDTHSYHSESVNTSRVTPLLAGYYRFTAAYVTVARGDYNNIGCAIFKNGATAGTWARRGESAFNVVKSIMSTAILSANGSTDFFEMMVYQINTAAVASNSSTGGGFASVLEWDFLRPL